MRGDAYVGEILAGDVGGWKDPTTDFLRRWVRCDADGTACTYIQEVATTEPEDGPTYEVRADDVGYTLRLRVTADVNNDLTPDGIDNHLPARGRGRHAADRRRHLPAGRRRRLPGLADARPRGLGPGHHQAGDQRAADDPQALPREAGDDLQAAPVGGREAAHRHQPRRQGPQGQGPLPAEDEGQPQAQALPLPEDGHDAAQGRRPPATSSIRFKRKLKPGRYRATIVATDAAGNTSAPGVLQFRVIRKKR